MKITIIGAGAYRILAIMRSAMAVPGLLDEGEVALCDLDEIRAEVMGKLLMKTPEYRRARCKISWGKVAEKALPGSDAVAVILPAGSMESYLRSQQVCVRHGFISSDNVSPNGDFCGIKIAPVILNIVRLMEIHCPKAWLLNFVNPAGVLSGMVNNHTKIRALGMCAGFTNHLWDISRIFGKDEEALIASELDVDVAGVNHLSIITGGTWRGRELFQALRERITPDWTMCELQPWRSTFQLADSGVPKSVRTLVRFWREYGVMVFSTEGDGLDHLRYTDAIENQPLLEDSDVSELLKKHRLERQNDDRTFKAYLDCDLSDEFWSDHWQKDERFARVDQDIFVRVFKGLAGVEKMKIATSYLNKGAISGIKDRDVVEYSQTLYKDSLQPAGRYEIPDVVHGMISSLATHQTLLGDALATGDPQLLAYALLSYPMDAYTVKARKFYKEMLSVNRDSIDSVWQKAVDFL